MPGVERADGDDEIVIVGRIAGLYGVKGWVKVFSHTDPRENILRYSPWLLHRGGRWHEVALREGRRQGKGLVARLDGCDDRDAATAWLGADVAIRRGQLPPPAEDEYYWADLVGLRVETTEGVDLGVVDHLVETGANDVLVVQGDRERLVPFTPGDAVLAVDLEAGRIEVDWDPDF